ncbi:MAG: type II secretion system F family protein [Eubacteriales bacterium]|nr:type II secretion system F family protein [Eubacteriales bacterium]
MGGILLSIGTVLSILFIIMLFKGGKYDYMLESLSGDAFPFKSMYSVGLAWQDFKIGKLRGVPGNLLRKDANLYYSKKYSEYYARIIWAQVISLAHACLAFFFVLAGVFNNMSGFLGIVGVVVCVIIIYYFFTFTSGKIKTRTNECEKEFPNAISKLALIVNSGVILHESWEMVAFGNKGTLYEMMQDSCEQMKNGVSEIDAIYEFGQKTNSDDIKKFTSALIQSIERGGGDLPQFLANQSSELWATRRQVMLQKGEKAAGALLMPIALMFLGVMMIVLAAAMQSFGL